MATKVKPDKTVTEVAEGIAKKYKKKGGAIAAEEIVAITGTQPKTLQSLGLNTVTLPYMTRCPNDHRSRRVLTDGKTIYCPVCGQPTQPL